MSSSISSRFTSKLRLPSSWSGPLIDTHSNLNRALLNTIIGKQMCSIEFSISTRTLNAFQGIVAHIPLIGPGIAAALRLIEAAVDVGYTVRVPDCDSDLTTSIPPGFRVRSHRFDPDAEKRSPGPVCEWLLTYTVPVLEENP